MFSPQRKNEARSVCNPFSRSRDGTAVEIIESLGEWFVRVIENRIEHVAVFAIEPFALAYAEEQRLRLGLDRVTRF